MLISYNTTKNVSIFNLIWRYSEIMTSEKSNIKRKCMLHTQKYLLLKKAPNTQPNIHKINIMEIKNNLHSSSMLII